MDQTEGETRADVARRRLAQLAAAFDAEAVAPDAPTPAPAPRRIVAPQHVRVVAVVVVAAGVVLAWFLLAQRPQDAEPVEPIGLASASTSAAPAELVVDVVGQVRKPGIVTVPSGSRVHEAIEAAGGLAGKVDTSGVNLARKLEDGEQIVVGPPEVTGDVGAASGAGAAGGKIDLNRATVEQLDTLPGVGPVTAEAIVAWREEHGRFSSVDDLLDVKGIGDATLAELRDLVVA